MYIDGLPEPFLLIFSSNPHIPRLLYFSHIPVILVSLMFGVFIYFRSGGKLASKILLVQYLIISIWCLLNIVSWVAVKTDRLMFVSSLCAPLGLSIFIFGLLFIKVLSGKTKSSYMFNIGIVSVLLFMQLWTNSRYGILAFNMLNAAADIPMFVMGWFYIISFWILFYTWRYVLKSTKKDNHHRNEITVIGSSFILCFTCFNLLSIVSAYLVIKGLDSNFTLETYGLLGLPVYMGTIAYSIARHNTFGMRIQETKVIVITILILVGAQLLFIQNSDDRLFTALTLIVCVILGYFLLKVIQSEDNNKREELEKINIILNEKNVEVEKANRELKKLDNAKTEFINIASHQLRSPLTIVKGVASLLVSRKIDKFSEEDKQDFYNSVWSKCLKLEQIIDDILNAATFTSKKFSVMNRAAEEVDLLELVHKILDDLRQEIDSRELQVKVRSKRAENCMVYAQKKYLEEALINLIVNAIKYTPSSKKTDDIRETRNKKGKIDISIGFDQPHRDRILITISDNGIGIPQEELPYLFDRFYRAENARRMYTDGTGLGLFIVREIIDGHGGRIWVESLLDKGTTFFVSLPVSSVNNPDIRRYIIEKSSNRIEYTANK